MTDFTSVMHQVTHFYELVATPYHGIVNAICWTRELNCDFSEIVAQFTHEENILVIDEEALLSLALSEQGQLAREVILGDLRMLNGIGATPVLNVIKNYERDENFPLFPTDVYSFHADRAPIPTDTYLCTYYGAASEILPNAQAELKVLVPEIREELKKQYHGPEEGFETFLKEQSFDLHYRAMPEAKLINLGNGHVWKLAVDHPELKVPPCIHRAPRENPGEYRLLLIC